MAITIKNSLGLLFGAFMASGNAMAGTNMTEDESIATDYMTQHQVTSFVMMNKKSGKILLIENNKIIANFNALSGAIKGDASEKGMTPSGVFPLTFIKDIPLYQHAIVFNYKPNQDTYTAIHPVLDIKGENRMARLQSPTPTDNKISHDGCLNVWPTDFKTIYEFTTKSTKAALSDGGKYHQSSNGFLVILPEETDVKTTFPLLQNNQNPNPQ